MVRTSSRNMTAMAAAVGAPLLAVDQAAKLLVRRSLPLCGPPFVGCRGIPVLGRVSLMQLGNAGSPGGLVGGPLLWTVLAASSLALIPVYCRRFRPGWPAAGALGLQVSGALSNLLDRMVVGRATDYLAVRIRFLPSPAGPVLEGLAVNLADLALLVGTVLAIAALVGRSRLRSASPGHTVPRREDASGGPVPGDLAALGP